VTQVSFIDPASSSASAKPTLDTVKAAFGVAPNMFEAVAYSSVALAAEMRA